MEVDFSPILTVITQLWAVYGAVFLRVGTAILVLPGLGETALPARLRLGAAIALTLVVAPAVIPRPDAAQSGAFGWGLSAEPIAGLALGLILRLFIHALQIAGAIIAQASSLAQIFGGGIGEPQPAVGHLLTIGGLALAFASGLHIRLAVFLIESYQLIPLGMLPDPTNFRIWSVKEVGHVFGLAFSIAAPFVIASLVYNVALGVINRAMPQLMVAFVGAPALTFGGLALMMLAIPAGIALWHASFVAFLANPTGPGP